MIKRNTIQKQLIIGAVEALNIHATAEEVYEYIAKDNPSISKATVYRNLNSMVTTGELLNIGTFMGATHYDHNTHEHYHFVCEGCGVIFDVECDLTLLEKLQASIKPSSDYSITTSNILFGGTCQKCKIKRELAILEAKEMNSSLWVIEESF